MTNRARQSTDVSVDPSLDPLTAAAPCFRWRSLDLIPFQPSN